MSSADLQIIMNWRNESLVSEHPEPDDFVYTIAGDLYDVSEDAERRLAGKFTIHYVDVERAINDGVSLYDVMDAHSQTTADYYDVLFTHKGDFNEDLLELLRHDIVDANVLILDRLELLPRYRGRMLGLRLMRHMINRFSAGTGVVGIKPFPLQFEVEPTDEDRKTWRTNMALAELPGNEVSATNRLREYYGALGFLPIADTPFMVRSSDRPLPSPDG